jgi:hypothetical protein
LAGALSGEWLEEDRHQCQVRAFLGGFKSNGDPQLLKIFVDTPLEHHLISYILITSILSEGLWENLLLRFDLKLVESKEEAATPNTYHYLELVTIESSSALPLSEQVLRAYET